MIAVALAALPTSGFGQRSGHQSTTMNPIDREWISLASLDGLAQMDVGYEALALSHRRDVKALALELVNFESPVLKRLERHAAARGIHVPKDLRQYPQYMPEHPWEVEGTDFDLLFMRQQVERGQATLELFERETVDGADQDLRTFAWSYLPQLRERVARAKVILSRVKDRYR